MVSEEDELLKSMSEHQTRERLIDPKLKKRGRFKKYIKEEVNSIDLKRKVFDIKDEPRPRGAWWWWFWLFFFNNPKNPKKPRQLMILWSTKNVKQISCNNLKIRLNPSQDRNKLDGAVAAWYFDGEKMHHNFLLEQCKINVTDNELFSTSNTPTSFSVHENEKKVRIGDNFRFVAEVKNKHNFATSTYHSHTYFRNIGYSLLRSNHHELSGKIGDENIHGSAYFQRVFVNAPSPSWYWGIFHFEKGGILTYFNPHLFGKSLKKNISFFDGNRVHEFADIQIEKSGKLPTFIVSGENGHEKINFTVQSYSHSSWTFRKKTLGIIPNKLIYNEYPAVISDLSLTNRRTGEENVLEDFGKSVGNAEHTTGFLL
jgi:hypothetical protein